MAATSKTLLRPPARTRTDKPITSKQGKPSASGEVIDTSKAKIMLPPSAEVRAAQQGIEKKVTANDESVERDNKDRQEAVLEMADDAEAKAEASPIKRGGVKKAVAHQKAKARSAGNGSGPAARLTETWGSKTRKDIKNKDRVRTAEGIVVDVTGRYTGKTGNRLIPMLVGKIVTLPAGATVAAGDTKKSDGKGKRKGDRLQGIVASGCTHCK